MYPLPALPTPLPLIPFTTDEVIGCTNEAPKIANKASRNSSACFFISCITNSVTPSLNTQESPNDFMIIIISFIFSFEINKVNFLLF